MAIRSAPDHLQTPQLSQAGRASCGGGVDAHRPLPPAFGRPRRTQAHGTLFGSAQPPHSTPRQHSSWLPVLPPPAAACPAASAARTPGWFPSPSLPAERGAAGGAVRLATVTTARYPACTAAGGNRRLSRAPLRRARLPSSHLTPPGGFGGASVRSLAGLGGEGEGGGRGGSNRAPSARGSCHLHRRWVTACMAIKRNSSPAVFPQAELSWL